MGWRGWVAVTVLVGCGRTPLFGDRVASGSGAAGESSTFVDDDESNDGPREPDEIDPPDEPTLDVASELPPAECGVLPPVPSGPPCDLPNETRHLLAEDAQQAVLTVDEESVYAVLNHLDGSQVVRIDKCSGETEWLDGAGVNPANVIVVDEHVIWTDYVPGGGVWRMPIDGGEPVAIATGDSPLALALFDPWIVYSSYEGVFRIPRGGGDVEPVVESELRFFVNLASDGVLLFGNAQAEQTIAWIDPLDGSYGEYAVKAYAGDVLADCEWLFWSDEYGFLHRIDRAGGDDVDLGLRVYRFVHDETHVFASTGESQVIAVDKATGESRVVADLPGETPWRIAIDTTHVYWTSAVTGDVWAAPNPWL
jgi:hypothetical protein